MACKIPEDDENLTYQLKEDFFICSICTERWVLNDPRDLPCRHTFCRSCLEKLKKAYHGKETKCPTCRTKIFWSKGGIKNLPKNLVASNVIQTVQRNIEENSIRRECKDHGEEIIFICLDCSNKEICKECWKINHKSHKIDDPVCFNNKKLKEQLSKSISDIKLTVEESALYLRSIIPEYNDKFKQLLDENLLLEKEKIDKKLENDLRILNEFENHLNIDKNWKYDDKSTNNLFDTLDIIEELLINEIENLTDVTVNFGDVKKNYGKKNHLEEIFKQDLSDRIKNPILKLKSKLLNENYRQNTTINTNNINERKERKQETETKIKTLLD